jgi:DNA replication and repair protein RecF
MKILSLHLSHFRNIAQAQLDFDPVQTLLIGANGQGKTNVLEALYVGSHARSFRTANERELMQHGQPKAQIKLVLDGPQGLTDLEICWTDASMLDPSQPKRLKVGFTRNGVTLKSRSQLLGTLPTVSFFVSDLLLLRGAPEDRRRWLDAAVVQYDPRHFAWLAEFNKVRQHKSQLLKQPPEQLDLEHLAAWNQRLAETAAWVMAARLQYLKRISPLIADAYQGLSAHTTPMEVLTLGYVTSLDRHCEEGTCPIPAFAGTGSGNLQPSSNNLETTVAALTQSLLQQLTDRQADECRRGVCLVGPHRDDIRYDINGYDASAYGSQGQQRSIVLAAKVAELRALQAKLNDPPVLLLDDVMAELDPDRQARLMDCWGSRHSTNPHHHPHPSRLARCRGVSGGAGSYLKLFARI